LNFKSSAEKIDKNELISFAQKLIRTPSVSGSEEEAGKMVAKKLAEIGLEVETVGGNVIGKLAGDNDQKTLALCGHIDTVGVTEPDSWTVDPHSATVKDNILWGLGSADMKAGLAAQIMAIDAIKKSKVSRKGNVLFVATVMEETGREKLEQRRGIIELLDKGLMKADATVIAEPTDLLVGRGHKGICDTILTAKGKTAHGSLPEKGVNAIEKMSKVIMAMKGMKLGYHPELGPGTLTPCVIQGGIKLAIVPDTCTVLIDRRLTVDESKDTVQKEMDKLFSDLKRDDPDLNLTAEYPYSYEAVITPADHAVIKSIDLAHRDVTEQSAKVGFIPFGTDGAWVNKLTKCPVIVYGPGNVAHAHKPNEHVELRQVEEASKVYAALIGHYLS